MQFYLVEGNIGEDTTREQVDNVITLLRQKGWKVEYGAERNKAEDVTEFGREEEIQALKILKTECPFAIYLETLTTSLFVS